MSKVEIVKNICDRCGKELRYPILNLFPSKNTVKAYAKIKSWGNGYPIMNVMELCYECQKDFEKFMEGREETECD